jgi:hypothetical protein
VLRSRSSRATPKRPQRSPTAARGRSLCGPRPRRRLGCSSAAPSCSRTRPRHAAGAGNPLLGGQVRDAVPGSARGGRARRCWRVASRRGQSRSNLTNSTLAERGLQLRLRAAASRRAGRSWPSGAGADERAPGEGCAAAVGALVALCATWTVQGYRQVALRGAESGPCHH